MNRRFTSGSQVPVRGKNNIGYRYLEIVLNTVIEHPVMF